MKVITGLSALLLGTTLLVGAANAQNKNNNNNNNPPPPPPAPHGFGPPPPAQGNPGGHPNFGGRFSGHPNFSGQHFGQNQMRWNHVVTVHDHNVAHFNAQDRAMWTGGQWRHTRHNGRIGWWWNTNGAWFFYDEPIYPYPGYVSDDYSFDDDYADGPQNQAGPGPDGYVWYYCSNPSGYYPYIQSCRGPWQPVQPSPPPGYNQGPQQGGPDADQDDDQGPPPGPQPHGQYEGQQGGPPPGYNNGDDDDNQGPPPPGYNGNQGPPGYGPPPGYSDQPPR